VLVLRGVCSAEAAEPLLAEARALPEGVDVLVKCEALEHVHGAVVQILCALRTALAARGQKLRCEERAPALDKALDLCGLQGLL
jgi:anti-anti-sigma regulatory factor